MAAMDFFAAVSPLQHLTTRPTCLDFPRVCEGCHARAERKIHIAAARY
jgi:hypothetical protein